MSVGNQQSFSGSGAAHVEQLLFACQGNCLCLLFVFSIDRSLKWESSLVTPDYCYRPEFKPLGRVESAGVQGPLSYSCVSVDKSNCSNPRDSMTGATCLSMMLLVRAKIAISSGANPLSSNPLIQSRTASRSASDPPPPTISGSGPLIGDIVDRSSDCSSASTSLCPMRLSAKRWTCSLVR